MFRKLMTLDEAKRVINQQLKLEPLGIEEIPILEANNRVLAEDVAATMDIPPFDRSTVDGYAVKAEDTYCAVENQPVKLKICGSILIGESPRLRLAKGEAAEIVTGAPIPDGADAVVMAEDVEREGSVLAVYNAVTYGENVMKRGADIRKGERVLKKGQVLGSREIGILAALGEATVKVYRLPIVAVFSTGGEVVEPGNMLSIGKIYDINAYSLSTAVVECGGKPMCLGVVPDDGDMLRRMLEHAVGCADVVVTSGGVSVGPRDLMPQTLSAVGRGRMLVCGVAVKPGKPTTVGLVDGKLVFALPGHPASALLMFHLLVRPIIQRLGGRVVDGVSVVKAVAGARMFSAKGRRTFIMVRLRSGDVGRLVADPVESGGSGAITTLAKADGFVVVSEDQQFIDVGEEVSVELFGGFACVNGLG